ncbi:STAS domain-containing protein [Streptomyces sp. NPDC050264]|uniref:STAS domain-containing protein n=1 Tax=Streptomyces sp. NPDC050264 TaxID=3155038 RepID=UPI003446EFD3
MGTLLDLSDLTFADSTLLNLVLRAHAEHRAALRPFVLAGPCRSGVQRLFRITGVTDVLVLTATRSDGMRRIHGILDANSPVAPDEPAPWPSSHAPHRPQQRQCT